MNSTELTNLAEWKKWGQSVVPEAPLVPGISAKTRNRFKDHLRVMEVERNVAYRLRRVEREAGRLEVSWECNGTPEKAKDAERRLLAKYDEDHLEFPPLNRLESRKMCRMVEELLKLAPGRIQDLLDALRRNQSGEIDVGRSITDSVKEDT